MLMTLMVGGWGVVEKEEMAGESEEVVLPGFPNMSSALSINRALSNLEG